MLRLAIYGVLAITGIALGYLELQGVFSSLVSVLLPIILLSITAFVVRHDRNLVHLKISEQSDQVHSRAADFAKSVTCMIFAIAWAFLAGSVTRDTPLGNAAAAGPSLFMLIVGGLYFGRATRIRIR
jgi:uncharacterized membrane protein YbjE (DUF340 family)